MQLVDTCRIGYFDCDLVKAINELKKLFVSLAPGVPLVITSWNDSTHRQGSLHYMDQAVDIRSHDLTTAQKHAILDAARQAYDNEIGIILENEGQPEEHYHVQVGVDGLLFYERQT